MLDFQITYPSDFVMFNYSLFHSLIKLISLLIFTTLITFGIDKGSSFAYDYNPPTTKPCQDNPDDCDGKSDTRGGAVIKSLIPREKVGLAVSNSGQTIAGELTYEPSPTFWLYTFSPEDKPILLELKIKDLSSQKIYERTIRIEQTPIFGIISFTLPKDLLELKVNGIYQWQLSIDGQEEKIDGYLQRKPHPSQLNGQLSSEQRMEWYAKNGIWYDLITELAQLRLQDPNNSQLKEQWDTLLEDSDVDLGYLKQQPLLDCCSVSEAN